MSNFSFVIKDHDREKEAKDKGPKNQCRKNQFEEEKKVQAKRGDQDKNPLKIIPFYAHNPMAKYSDEKRMKLDFSKTCVQQGPKKRNQCNVDCGKIQPDQIKYPVVDHSLDEYRIIGFLGKGTFGTVYLVQEIEKDMLYALKVINLQKATQKNYIREIKRELEIGTRIQQNQHLLATQGFFIERGCLFIILQFCEYGSLYDYVYNVKNRTHLTERDSKVAISQICDGIGFLHNKKIMHRDLKPENVLIHRRVDSKIVKPKMNLRNQRLLRIAMAQLQAQDLLRQEGGKREKGLQIMKKISKIARRFKKLFYSGAPPHPEDGFNPEFEEDEELMKQYMRIQCQKLGYPNNVVISFKHLKNLQNCVLKINDFGTSAHSNFGQKKSYCGTITYMAPELIKRQVYSYNVDIWAIGVLAYQLTQGDVPFYSRDSNDLKYRIVKQKYDQKWKVKISKEGIQFIESILNQKDPSERPTVKELLNHPWISQLTENFRARTMKYDKIYFREKHERKAIQKDKEIKKEEEEEEVKVLKGDLNRREVFKGMIEKRRVQARNQERKEDEKIKNFKIVAQNEAVKRKENFMMQKERLKQFQKNFLEKRENFLVKKEMKQKNQRKIRKSKSLSDLKKSIEDVEILPRFGKK